MTIQPARGSAPDATRAARIADRMSLAAAFLRGMVKGLRLQIAVDLRALRKRRQLRLQTVQLLDYCIDTELAQARGALEFTYRNNLDIR